MDLLEFPLTREVANEFFQIDIAGVPICVDLNEGEPRQSNLGLEVDDLDATVAVLRNKGLAVHPGRNPALMEEWIGVKDPDGNEIIFRLSARK